MPRRPRYSEEEARAAIARSQSFAEALRRLGMRPAGGNHRTLQKYVWVWQIAVDHFDPSVGRKKARRHRRPLDEVLTANSLYSRRTLKRRLYTSGLKRRRCELCGQGETWQGRRMSLILDHINGIATDNRLENLRIVCPNCAATLETHCGKNVALVRLCAHCGDSFRPSGRTQRHCSRRCGSHSDANRAAKLASRKVERPRHDTLLAEIAEQGYSAVGRRYGVSDNAVRKWIREGEVRKD